MKNLVFQYLKQFQLSILFKILLMIGLSQSRFASDKYFLR